MEFEETDTVREISARKRAARIASKTEALCRALAAEIPESVRGAAFIASKTEALCRDLGVEIPKSVRDAACSELCKRGRDPAKWLYADIQIPAVLLQAWSVLATPDAKLLSHVRFHMAAMTGYSAEQIESAQKWIGRGIGRGKEPHYWRSLVLMAQLAKS